MDRSHNNKEIDLIGNFRRGCCKRKKLNYHDKKGRIISNYLNKFHQYQASQFPKLLNGTFKTVPLHESVRSADEN